MFAQSKPLDFIRVGISWKYLEKDRLQHLLQLI